MGNWVVTWRYKPNPEFQDTGTHHRVLDNMKKEMIPDVLPHLVRHGEYIEILEIKNAKAYDREIFKSKDYFKTPCSIYKNKFKCEEFMHGRDCANCCDYAIKEGENGK